MTYLGTLFQRNPFLVLRPDVRQQHGARRASGRARHGGVPSTMSLDEQGEYVSSVVGRGWVAAGLVGIRWKRGSRQKTRFQDEIAGHDHRVGGARYQATTDVLVSRGGVAARNAGRFRRPAASFVRRRLAVVVAPRKKTQGVGAAVTFVRQAYDADVHPRFSSARRGRFESGRRRFLGATASAVFAGDAALSVKFEIGDGGVEIRAGIDREEGFVLLAQRAT